MVDGYPTTVNGKLDNTALLLMVDQHPLSPAGSEGGNSRDENDGASIESWLLDFVSDVLECSVEDLDTSLGLGHQGFNSLHYALLANQICDSFACDVTTAQLLPLASLDEVIESSETMCLLHVGMCRRRRPRVRVHRQVTRLG